MNDLQYQKTLPMRYEADLLVAGGGPAGIAAAVTAARQGLKVILAEQTGTPGGCGTLAMVPELMNFDDGEHFPAGGFRPGNSRLLYYRTGRRHGGGSGRRRKM